MECAGRHSIYLSGFKEDFVYLYIEEEGIL